LEAEDAPTTVAVIPPWIDDVIVELVETVFVIEEYKIRSTAFR
jgi:hypothetical protein